MKFGLDKSFPYPVLRVENRDYENVKFRAECELARVSGSTDLKLSTKCVLSDPDLLGLIKSKKAAYCVLVRCQSTHFRESYLSYPSSIDILIKDSHLAGRTEVLVFLVCTREVLKFRATHWHENYQGLDFNLGPGFVLAQSKSWTCWIE